ncbi:hypothetical protein, partial [Hydrocoleum sp. CS-953]|uniref:hypothetical protein n=1 Tax=Hydrocoleum sp. CS-953 TaxID=1671698 RepID=UPI001AF01DDC
IFAPGGILINSSNCSQTEEISYRSRKLASPDGNKSVYFNTIFRRLGSDEYSLRFGCARIFQTPSINLVIESARQEKTIDIDINTKFAAFLDRELTSYALVNLIPISFSPDGRFLAVRANYDFGETEHATSLLIIDLSTERLLKNHSDSDLYCRRSEEIPGQDVSYQTLIGFTSPTEFIVNCHQPYGCRGNLRMCKWSELVNLTNQTSQGISIDSVDVKMYGKVISPEEIKHQIVPRR